VGRLCADARLAWLAPVILALLGAELSRDRTLGGTPPRFAARRRLPHYAAPRSAMDAQGSPRFGGATRDSALRTKAPLRPNRTPCAKTLFSERGTLVAIAAGYLLLWLKARF